MAVQHGFDLFRENFPSGEIDDGGLAGKQEQESFRIYPPDVTGEKPAIAQHVFARNPRSDISVEYPGSGHGDFAATVSIRIVDAHAEISGGLADGIPTREGIVGVEVDEAEFNHAKTLRKRDVKTLQKTGGKVALVRIGVTGLSNRAYRAEAAEKALSGTAGSAADVQAAAALVPRGIDANSDLFASADYRKHLAVVYAARAMNAALAG